MTEEGAKDLYLKPSMLHSIASTTEHPEAAATLVNFLVNSPEAGAIFGTNRGLPASETMLEGAELDPLGQQIRDYEESIADRLGDAPPVPIVGYGTLEEKFRLLGQELGFGTLTPEEAVGAVLQRDGRRPQPVTLEPATPGPAGTDPPGPEYRFSQEPENHVSTETQIDRHGRGRTRSVRSGRCASCSAPRAAARSPPRRAGEPRTVVRRRPATASSSRGSSDSSASPSAR